MPAIDVSLNEGDIVALAGPNGSGKTVKVAVSYRERHPIYGKIITRTKKYHAHDEADTAKVGDVVTIMETRPMSATKRWRIVEK